MSGIFGFTYRTEDRDVLEQTLGGLEYWNRIYGRDSSDHHLMDRSGIGCHIEHFSDRFPFGGPILHSGDSEAVIDALLYNRDELEKVLSLPCGCSLSDEEMLLKLIREKGYNALSLVNGDFCGAVYDRSCGKWTLFRDHLGVRPLYFYHDEGIFVFSTDIRGIASVPGVELPVNGKRLFASLTFSNHLSLRETDYTTIRCILPGAVTEVKMGTKGFSIREKPYWKLRSRRIRLSSDRAYETHLRELVEDSIRRRLDAIPGLVGAELSGGLDSSVVDILINRTGRAGCYFSWSPDASRLPLAEGEDERKVIADICRQEGIECRYLGKQDTHCADLMYDRVIPSFVDTLQLSYGSRWMHSQGARAIFTGHGGDEGVSHRASRFELLCNGELLSYFRLYYEDLAGRPMRLIKTIYSGVLDAIHRWRSIHEPLVASDLRCPVLCPEFNDRMIRTFVHETFYFSVIPHRYVMQGGTRYRLDNAAYQGASAGVRYLLPFVDHRVMDFAVSIPRRLYLTPEGNRMVYRNAFRDLMPESLAAVKYKDAPSMRDIPRKKRRDDVFRRNQEYISSRLDPEYWKGILDLEVIAGREQPEDPESEEALSFRYATYELYRCILIQNTALKAKDWRNIDEQPDLL